MMRDFWRLERGAKPNNGGGVDFAVWAPRHTELRIKLVDTSRSFPMHRDSDGVFSARVAEAEPGMDYVYTLPGIGDRPDPVSRQQAQGVHGPSRIVDPAAFAWNDQSFEGHPWKEYVIYELHTGTFTPDGRFSDVIEKLDYLTELGVTAIELMPVASFPGTRNWGYDGVSLYAPQHSYGGTEGLKQLVDACHQRGLSVILDVVYNHLGPEGNYLRDFGPYFSERYHTPWGDALNFDDLDSDNVRRFFIDNALYWLSEFHIDALRLDAIHGIFDFSAKHIVEEIAGEVHAFARQRGRPAYVIAESDLNDARVIRPPDVGGWGCDAQWSDDFHHALYTTLTGRRKGYLADYQGISDLHKALLDGFVYDGLYAKSRRRRHGSPAKDRPGEQFVVCTQNHDQVANGAVGKRLSVEVPPGKLKLAATMLLCAPNIPMLFMGEEFAASSPFLYFTSHTDQDLARQVSEGRKREFKDFADEAPFVDPQTEAAFVQSKLDWQSLQGSPQREILALYRALIAVRKRYPAFWECRRDLMQVNSSETEHWMVLTRSAPGSADCLVALNFARETRDIPIQTEGRQYRLILFTDQAEYQPSNASEIGVDPPESITTSVLRLPPFSAAIYATA